MSVSSVPDGFDSDSQDNFDDNFNNAQDTFNNTAKTISTAWIVGIVVIVVAVIVFAVLGVWLLRRNRRRRRERQKLDDNHDYVSPTAPLYSNGGQGHQPQQQPQYQQSPYPQQMEHNQASANPWREMQGSSYQPALVEAQDTGVMYRQTPNTETAASHNTSGGGQEHELSGIDSGRRELA